MEDEDDLPSDADNSFEEKDDGITGNRIRRKKFKNTGKRHRNLLLKFLFASFIIFFYFAGNYIISKKMIGDL